MFSGAYYTRLVSSNPKIHAIVLNNNLYYSSNDVTEGQEDPGGQLAWLNEQLNLVRTAGEKVGHKTILYEQIGNMAKASFLLRTCTCTVLNAGTLLKPSDVPVLPRSVRESTGTDRRQGLARS